MKIQLTSFEIRNESDIALSQYLAKLVASLAGLNLAEQLRFASAVCEITCNVIEHARTGNAIFNWQKNGHTSLEAVISDEGKGIKSLEKILMRDPLTHKGAGLGLVHARGLCDHFDITTGTAGTTVILQKTLSDTSEVPTKSMLKTWQKKIHDDSLCNPHDLFKKANHHLRSLTEVCKQREVTMKQQAAEIAALRARLEKHQSNMKDLTHTVSHDLRTPLTSLGLSLSLIDMDEIPEMEKSNLQIAGRSAKRLENMIKGLLEILEIHNPARQEIKKIDIRSLADKAVDGASRGLAEGSYRFNVQIAPGTLLVYNEPFMTAILSHLLSNAVKYRREIPLEVNIKTEVTQDGIRLHFRDNGSGIDMVGNARKLFTPFSRFTTESDGKGNGLYMIKTMVEKNGGSVVMESEVGLGTSFIIDLVAYKDETAEESVKNALN